MNKQHLDILIESEVKQLTQEQVDWLNKVVDGTWKYKQNGVVNVQGDVAFSHDNFTSIPVQFGYVSKFFNCGDNKLTTLKGCPYQIRGNFYCWYNQLTSLEYMPTKVGGKSEFSGNQFILNDKLFEDLAKIGRKKIGSYNTFMYQLKEKIPIQFGISDETIIDEIWQSYMAILNKG